MVMGNTIEVPPIAKVTLLVAGSTASVNSIRNTRVAGTTSPSPGWLAAT